MRVLVVDVPIAMCREHGSIVHRVCSQCGRGCMDGRYSTATRCFDCASQRSGSRQPFRTAYHRIRAFASEEEGAAV